MSLEDFHSDSKEEIKEQKVVDKTEQWIDTWNEKTEKPLDKKAFDALNFKVNEFNTDPDLRGNKDFNIKLKILHDGGYGIDLKTRLGHTELFSRTSLSYFPKENKFTAMDYDANVNRVSPMNPQEAFKSINEFIDTELSLVKYERQEKLQKTLENLSTKSFDVLFSKAEDMKKYWFDSYQKNDHISINETEAGKVIRLNQSSKSPIVLWYSKKEDKFVAKTSNQESPVDSEETFKTIRDFIMWDWEKFIEKRKEEIKKTQETQRQQQENERQQRLIDADLDEKLKWI